MGESKTSDQIKIKIKVQNLSREHSAHIKAPNQDLKDMDVLFKFKINFESHNLKQGCIRNQWQYPNQDQDAKSQ